MYDLDNIKAGWGARARAEDGEIIVGLIRMDRIRYKYIRDKIRESSAFEWQHLGAYLSPMVVANMSLLMYKVNNDRVYYVMWCLFEVVFIDFKTC